MDLFGTKTIGDEVHAETGLLRTLGGWGVSLPGTTRLYFLIWMSLGLLIYATYPVRYSRQAKTAVS